MKPIIKLCVGLLLVVAICSSLAFAESTVVTCKGKYVMGDMDTKKNARCLALMEAKRSALEQAGTFLESSSEVKNYELTKDEINSLASGIISVEVLKEEWKMSGENLMVTVLIRATVDISNLQERISALKDDSESVEELKNIQDQLAALQEELQELKARQAEEAEKQTKTSKKDLREQYVAVSNTMTALELLKNASADLTGGRWEEALAGYNEVLSVDPEMAGAYTGKAIALNRMGKPHKAFKKIDKAIKIAPDSARARLVKAWTLKNLGSYPLALKSINKAIELNPLNPKSYFVRGNIKLKLNKPHKAFNDFERACRMGHREACQKVKKLTKRLKQKHLPRSVPPKAPRRKPKQRPQ